MNNIEHNHRRLLLSESFLFRDMPKEDLDKIVDFTKVKHAKAKEVIFRKDESGQQMFIIIKGRVSLSTSSASGKELNLGMLGEGEIFGEISLIDKKERTATVTAKEATDMLVIDRTYFIPFIKKNPDVAITLLKAMATRLRVTDQLFEDTVFRQLPGRLARKFLTLARDFGKEYDDGYHISIPLSQNDIGKMTSASRESVNKQMRIWEDEGLIGFDKGYITINNPEALMSITD